MSDGLPIIGNRGRESSCGKMAKLIRGIGGMGKNMAPACGGPWMAIVM